MIKLLLLKLVQLYQLLLRPWLGSQCRFQPSCSDYALQALELHGAARGSYLAAKRLLRCHPWCAGGHDPVPGKIAIQDKAREKAQTEELR